MEIKTCQYNEDNATVQVNGTMSVPCDDDNRHWQMVKEWLAEGNVIAPYVAPELTYAELRMAEYGSPAEQLEYIVENGLDGFITRQLGIKAKYPKA